MSFNVGDVIIDIRGINSLEDTESRRKRSGTIIAMTADVAKVEMATGVIEEIHVEYLMYKRVIT